MKLTKVFEMVQRFPDNTESSSVELVFEDSKLKEPLRKKVKISSCAKKVNAHLRNEAAYQITKACREVACDAAYMYSKDNWVDYLEEFTPSLTKDLLREAIQLLATGATNGNEL